MASKRYPPKVVAQAKRFFIYEGWSFDKISQFFDGAPHKKTIELWSAEEDADGKDWTALRQDYIDSIVNAVTPEQIQALYTKRIYETLSDPSFNSKHADALAKLQKQFSENTDPGRQIPVMYELLTQLLNYCKNYYPDLVTPALLQAVTDFKNMKREEFFELKL